MAAITSAATAAPAAASAARQCFWAAGRAPAFLHPVQEVIQIGGGDAAQGSIWSQVLRQQVYVGGESFNRVNGMTLVIQVDLPGIDRRDEGCLLGDMSGRTEGSGLRGHVCLQRWRINRHSYSQ